MNYLRFCCYCFVSSGFFAASACCGFLASCSAGFCGASGCFGFGGIGHAPLSHTAFSLVGPSHAFPPLLGAGLLQVRVRVICPLPHVTEQALYALHAEKPPSTGGQASVLHACSWIVSPSQFLPPKAGGGSLHCLFRDCFPPPHGLSHGENAVHWLNFPFIGQIFRKHGLWSLSAPKR